MKLLLLDMNEMESEEAVHNYLMEKLAFPEYYGKNLDALSDMLTDGAAGNVCVELVRCTALDAPVKKFEAKLETVLEDAAQTVEERDGKFYAVFAGFEPLEPSSMWG